MTKGFIFWRKDFSSIEQLTWCARYAKNSSDKYHHSCITQAHKHGTQIHVWGAIGWRSPAPLKVLHGNLNENQYQVQFLHDIDDLGIRCIGIRLPWYFMQNLALAHKAHIILNLLAQNGVRVLDWPGNSPDLNQIENVWAFMAPILPRTLPRNEEELWERVNAVWTTIPQGYKINEKNPGRNCLKRWTHQILTNSSIFSG